MSGWSPALRIARRELRRSKGRSAVVLLMVLLPVVAVSAGSTLVRTQDVSTVEGLPRELGSSTARLEFLGGAVEQDPTLDYLGQRDPVDRPAPADVLAALPAGASLLPVAEDYSARLQLGERRRSVTTVAVDLRDPAQRGPFSLLSGRAPRGDDEVAASPDLLAEGVAVGDVLQLDRSVEVVGVVATSSERDGGKVVYGLPAAVGLQDRDPMTYFVSGADVRWDDVLALNGLGFAVLSRSAVLDPPPASEVPQPPPGYEGASVTLAVVGVVTVMAVLQVVLLAGPAFAVGARRSRRALGLVAASGGEPKHVRRVVLAQGLLVGLLAAGLGVPLGVLVAALAVGPVEAVTGSVLGPFEVSPLDLALIALLGAGTALLASLVPAVLASRQPVVAALAGRRVTRAGAGRPAALGVVLLAAGVALTLSALSSSSPLGGFTELGVAIGAVPTVLGAVLLAPAALALAGRLAARLPLPLRFAVRDADRQRGRTAPAVAAIAATVAGVVALGIANSSDAAANRRDYTPSGPFGSAVVAGSLGDRSDELVRRAEQAVPGERVTVLRGITQEVGTDGYTELQVCGAQERPVQGRCSSLQPTSYGGSFGSDVLVGDEALTAAVAAPPLSAARALAAGQVLLATDGVAPGTPVRLLLTRFDVVDGVEQVRVLASTDAEAASLQVSGDLAPARAVLPDAVADELGVGGAVALLVGDDLTVQQEELLAGALEPLDDSLYVRVERGYVDTADRVIQLVLLGVVVTLVLGGTLAATSLALSEARPDLTTLGQVGARPRTRRLVAGGYALVIGLVGAVLGTLAGTVPGVAAAVPLTRGFSRGPGDVRPESLVDVPWTLLLVVLVGLPLASAAVSALTARSSRVAARRVVA